MDFLSGIQWRPGIGDPTFVGWFTVCAYVLAAGLAAWAAGQNGTAGQPSGARARKLWGTVAVLLALLAVNKQLDLQSLFTDIGRVLSKSEGWYETRRNVQRWFVIGALVGSVSIAVWFTNKFRSLWSTHTLLFFGLFFLLTFIVIRAISFHHVDEFLGTHLAGIRMNWLLELTGIFLIALAACRGIQKSGERENK